VSRTYSDVDASVDPEAAVSSQEDLDSWPHIEAYKRRTRALLAKAERVLDVGCGPGLDVDALGSGRCVGVDRSRAMAVAARRRGPFVLGEASQLPFGDDTFEGVRADRVLQHLERPEQCLREMLRVCRSGGRVVLADPDQETTTISVADVPRSMTDRLKQLRRDVGYRNGRLISRLPEELTRLGVSKVAIDAFPLVVTRADRAFGLPGWPRIWRREGPFTDEDIDLWEQAVADRPIVYAVTYFVVSGTVP
jgi:ubiquinone/menaquinone biosynthesis C-methylase UbiE